MSFEIKRGLLRIDSRARDAATLLAQTGFRPRGLLLWWAERDELLSRGNRGGIGVHADGVGVAHAWFADDEIATDAVTHAVGDFAFVALGSALPAAPACNAQATLQDVGFTLEPGRPIREYNRPARKTLSSGRVPVIYEGIFRKRVAAP